MKHKCFAAVVLAAALLLTGCGGTQSSPSAAADQSSDSSRSTPSAVAQAAQTDRITDQWSLEKTVRGEMIGVLKLSIHVPQLVCDSPDAAALNEELADMYAAEYKIYEDDPDAEVPQGEESPQTEIINWDAYWYGDCVSLVMRSHDYEDAPWYYSGWCFDFATGRRLTTAEMLQHMGLDPDEVQAQMQRQAMQAFDREMAQGAYYEGLRSGGNLSEMRMRTLEYNELENLCLLLPQQDRLVLRGKYCSETDWGWQQLDVEIPLTPAAPADTPVLTDTYDGVQVQLEGTQATITLSPAPRINQWGDIGIRVEQTRTYPILGAYNEYVDVCIGGAGGRILPPGGLSADQRRRGGVCGRVALPHVRQRHDLSGPHLLCQQRHCAGTQRQRGEPAPGGWLCAGTGSPVGRVERAGDPLFRHRLLQLHRRKRLELAGSGQ